MSQLLLQVHSGFDDATLERHQSTLGPKMIKIKGDFNKVPLWLDCSRQMVPDFVVKDPTDSPVWEVTGAEFTRAEIHTAEGISIRFPRVTRIRSDKDWKSATNLAQLADLFKASKEVNTMTTAAADEEMEMTTPEKKSPPNKRKSSEPVTKNSPPKHAKKQEECDNSKENDFPPISGNMATSARSYDKRYIKTEKGFVVRMEDSTDTSNASKFVSGKDKSRVGDVASKKSTYRMVVKSEKTDEFATYESVRVCLANLLAKMKEDKVTSLRLVVDVNKEPLLGLDVHAVRTLLKNVFYEEAGVEVVMICPGIGPPPKPMVKKGSDRGGQKNSEKPEGVAYPFLKVFEGQPLTKIQKKF